MLIQVTVKPNSKKSKLIEIKNSQQLLGIDLNNNSNTGVASITQNDNRLTPQKYFIAYLKNKPQQGKANVELINLLYKTFTNAKQIKIIKGAKNTKKLVKVVL